MLDFLNLATKDKQINGTRADGTGMLTTRLLTCLHICASSLMCMCAVRTYWCLFVLLLFQSWLGADTWPTGIRRKITPRLFQGHLEAECASQQIKADQVLMLGYLKE